MPASSSSDDGETVLTKALPSADWEALIMWRVRWKTMVAQVVQLFTEARLRTSMVVGLSVLFWVGLFWLFYEGLEFLVFYVGGPGDVYHAQTVEFIFHTFFASLNVMLVFSSAIIMYSSLFVSPESRFLLCQPVRSERIVLHKFQEALVFSSWGFFLLASPMAIAYGIIAGAAWYYYALLLPLIIAFVYIPCAMGAFVCLGLIRFAPKLWRTIVIGVAILVIGLAARSIWMSIISNRSPMFGAEWFQVTLERFAAAQSPLLPSSWLTSGLLEAAQPVELSGIAGPWELPYVQSCLYLLVLISNALIFHSAIIWSGRYWYRDAFSLLECRVRRARKAQPDAIDQVADWLLRPLPTPVRLLLVKDWRLLRRDPVQWSQFLIFFGLLTLYFLNVDRFGNKGHDVSYMTWVNMVSFLNLAVVGLILSTFTTRFIFPMLSLEGRRFWVLGLMPVSRRTLVLSKFLFAAVGSWAPCALLVLLSDTMLRVPMIIVVLHQLTTALLCSGLAALAVGLGALMPDFKESSPSKIAAGFGGTLNLVLSAFYIIVVVVLTALPCHFYLIADGGAFHSRWLNTETLSWWLSTGAALATLTCLATTVIPLRKGIKAFETLEFK